MTRKRSASDEQREGPADARTDAAGAQPSNDRLRPRRLAAAAVVLVSLSWLVVTTSLPASIAKSSPDLALRLSPEHPAALIAKAERARADLLKLVGEAVETTSDGGTGPAKSGDPDPAREAAAPAATPVAADAGERERLRAVIRDLATRALRVTPLNATAHRLLGEISDDVDKTRANMQEAVRRSRRETIAAFWLLNDSVARNDAAVAMDYADVILRTRPELAPPVMGYVATIAATQTGRDLIARHLAAKPSWRALFYQNFPAAMHDFRVGLPLLAAIKSAGAPTTLFEGSILIDTFLGKGFVDLAYAAWLSMLSPDELSGLGLLTNPDFAKEPSGVSFDWRILAGTNAIAAFTRKPNGAPGRYLHIKLVDGRVRFPVVRQVVVLAPGRYRLEGRVKGSIVAKRGLQWDVRCLFHNTAKPLGETEMLAGRMDQWRQFAVDFDVILHEGCEAQLVRLFHDARSASEELITGDAIFDGLKLTRVTAAR